MTGPYGDLAEALKARLVAAYVPENSDEDECEHMAYELVDDPAVVAALDAIKAEAVREALEPLLRPGDPNARMNGYYIGFDRTGVGIVDDVLSAVATAAKRYHHTEDWDDEAVSLIQQAAIHAANSIHGGSNPYRSGSDR